MKARTKSIKGFRITTTNSHLISAQVPWINAQMFHVQLDREFDLATVEGKQLKIKRKEEEDRQKQAKLELKIFVDDRSGKTKSGLGERLLDLFFGKNQR